MEKITWQQDSSSASNLESLATIARWWSDLNGQEITFAQRLIPATGNLEEIEWEMQKFDEKFVLQSPQIRGITVYWFKSDSKQERNISPYKLELDELQQQLYIYPQTQKQVVIRVELPGVYYQTIELNDPQIAAATIGKNYAILLRDRERQLEVKLILSSAGLERLIKSLRASTPPS